MENEFISITLPPQTNKVKWVMYYDETYHGLWAVEALDGRKDGKYHFNTESQAVKFKHAVERMPSPPNDK